VKISVFNAEIENISHFVIRTRRDVTGRQTSETRASAAAATIDTGIARENIMTTRNHSRRATLLAGSSFHK